MLFKKLKVTFLGSLSFVVLEGLEPSQAEPESDVLPLHHRTILKCDAKVGIIFNSAKSCGCFFTKKCKCRDFSISAPSFRLHRRHFQRDFTGIFENRNCDLSTGNLTLRMDPDSNTANTSSASCPNEASVHTAR